MGARGPRRRPLSSPPPPPPPPLPSPLMPPILSIAVYSLLTRRVSYLHASPPTSPVHCVPLACACCELAAGPGRARGLLRKSTDPLWPVWLPVDSAPLAHVVCNILVQFGRCA